MDSNFTILRNIEDISIHLFNKIMTTNDYSLLVIEGNKEELQKECEEAWNFLFDEYFRRKKDGRILNSLSKHSELGVMRLKIVAIQTAITSLGLASELKDDVKIVDTKNAVIQNLNSVSIEFKKLKVLDSVSVTMDKLIAIHDILKRKYDMVNVRKEQVTEKEVTSIEKTLVDIQNVLGYSLGNPKEISVPLFIEYERSAKEKVKQSKRKK